MRKSKMFLVAGSLISAAAAYYLKSENGKKNLNSMIEKGSQMKDNLQSQSNDIISEWRTTAQEVIDTTITSMKAAEESVVSNAKDILENEDTKYEYLHNGYDLSSKAIQSNGTLKAESYYNLPNQQKSLNMQNVNEGEKLERINRFMKEVICKTNNGRFHRFF